MNILIITAHPNPQSFNSFILKQVRENIDKSHKLQVLDLYAEGFDPTLRFDEKHRRRDLVSNPKTAKYRDLVTWADQFYFHLSYLVVRDASDAQGFYGLCLCRWICLSQH